MAEDLDSAAEDSGTEEDSSAFAAEESASTTELLIASWLKGISTIWLELDLMSVSGFELPLLFLPSVGSKTGPLLVSLHALMYNAESPSIVAMPAFVAEGRRELPVIFFFSIFINVLKL